MDVIRKDASITNTDDGFPGTFEVILSAPTKDRDGDTLLPDEWKQPLPDHITFDSDHGMSVATTVGSGVPRIDEATGNLVVSGTYSSLPRAQEVRTLVNEGHIRTTSVAFMSEKSQKDGKTVAERELLNGAFVAIPSNREALVLASKGIKAGARNSKSDAEHIQAIHDHALALGASPGKSFGSASVTVTPEFIERVAKELAEDAANPADLALALDASLDEAINLLAAVDAASLPAEVQQALALLQAADVAADELLDALGVPDPDEDTNAASAAATDAAKAADVTAAETADELQTRVRALSLSAFTYTD
ncbi:MAG: hypothetical protein ACXVXP_00125 [Mycobacteriaceae bacterium]